MANHKIRICSPGEGEAVINYWEKNGWSLVTVCLDPGGTVDDQMPVGRTIITRGPKYHLFFRQK